MSNPHNRSNPTSNLSANPIPEELYFTETPQVLPPSYAMSQQYNNGNPPYDSDSDHESDNGERLSSIKLTINTPLVVKGDGNLVCVDPSVNASKVAMAVVSAFRQISSSAGGVPMIDQDGQPRPIDITVSAGVQVSGGNNVVGEKAILSKTVVGGAIMKIDPKQEGGPTANRKAKKRERAGSEPMEMDSKMDSSSLKKARRG